MKKTFIYDKIYKSEMQKTTNTNLAKYFSLAIIVSRFKPNKLCKWIFLHAQFKR